MDRSKDKLLSESVGKTISVFYNDTLNTVSFKVGKFIDFDGYNIKLLEDSNGNFDARYNLLTDSNNASRLAYTVIADAPWITGGVTWAGLDAIIPWADANVADDITVNWTGLDTYPEACAAGQYVTTVGDTLTCSLPDVNGFDVTFNAVAVDNNLSVSGITSLHGDVNITDGTSTGIGFSPDSNKIWSGGVIMFDNNGTHGCLGGC